MDCLEDVPLRQAQVRILGTEVRVNQAAITDGDGRYEFSKVPAGRYTSVSSMLRTGTAARL